MYTGFAIRVVLGLGYGAGGGERKGVCWGAWIGAVALVALERKIMR